MRMKDTKGVLISMIGIEYKALRQTSAGNVIRFVTAAVFILAILLLSFISVYYAFELIFHMWYVQVLLSIFFSLMFGIIYILLIQTFSKQPLAQKTKYRLNVSNILRGLFILFIGFLIAKPIEIMLLSKWLDDDIAQYRANLNTSFKNQVNAIYAGDIKKLNSKLSTYHRIGSIPQTEINAVTAQLSGLNNQKQAITKKAISSISTSPFFLQRVSLATRRYPISWLICAFVTALFFVPVVLIYRVSSNDDYYIDKRKREHALVTGHYTFFTRLYTKNFLNHFDIENVHFFETHSDPPFRTQRIPAPECSTEQEFFIRFRGYGLPKRLL